MQVGDVITATFAPKRADDLRPGASAYIGWRGQWSATFTIDEGPYSGQLALFPVGPGAPELPWVPECDLLIE